LVCVVAAVYWPQLAHAFQYDDRWKIVGNPRIRDAHLLLEDVRLGAYSEAITRLLPNLSLALCYSWFQLRPFGYHLFDLAFHLANVVLVFALARALAARMGGVSDGFAWLAAALFGLHPLNSEAVYYCNARPNLMLTTFYLSALCLLIDAIETKRLASWLACAACAMAALLCKEIAITLLVVAPLLVYWLSLAQPDPYARWVARARPVMIGVAVTGGAVLFFTGALAGLTKHAAHWSPADFALVFLEQSSIVVRYLGLWLVPWPGFLRVDYGALGHLSQRVHEQGASALLWPVIASVLLLAGIVVAFRARRRVPLVTFAWTFAALAHAPLWLVPRGEVMVEYRTYLPMVGLCMVLAYAIDASRAWLTDRGAATAVPTPSTLHVPSALFVLAACGLFTLARGDAWATERTLWNDVLAKAPDSPRAYLTLGELARRDGDIDGAIRLLQKSVELDPSYERAWANLGGLFTQRGELERARDVLLAALKLDRDDFQAANNLGNVLTSLHQPELAERYYKEALAIQPLFPEAELNLGHALVKRGAFDEGMRHYERALQLAPDLGAGYLLKGRAQLDHGDASGAIETWTRGLRVDARQPAMHAQLAQALDAAGQHDAAIEHLRTAIQLAPRNPDVVAAAERLAANAPR
jgi:tetratricopeptide (TPR) repeat protein